MASTVGDEIEPQIAEEDTQARSGLLFSGLKLWFSRVVPQRDWFIQNAQRNGATVVPLEKQADILIVDHMRKNQAPGTTSYRFVEVSIRKGQLEDVEAHAVGVVTRAARTVGSTTIAPKAGRRPYTDAEDQFLWNMIKPFEEKGGASKGNKIYEQIERINPTHPYQSWRDRWMRITQFQNRQITETLDIEPVAIEDDGPRILTQTTKRQTVHNSHEAQVVQPGYREHESRAQGRSSPRKRPRDEMEERGTLRSQLPQKSQAKQHSQTPRTRNQDIRDRHSASLFAAFSSQQSADKRNTEPPRVSASDKFPGLLPHRFTNYEATKLFDATGDLLASLKKDPVAFNTGWKDLANSEEFSGFTAKEWRHFWESIILPKYREMQGKQVEDVLESGLLGRHTDAKSQVPRTEDHRDDPEYQEPEIDNEEGDSVEEDEDTDESEEDEEVHSECEEYEDDRGNDVEDHVSAPPSSPGAVTCSKCFTSDSKKWRRDRDGNLLCNECGWFLKSSGVLRSSNTWTDLGDEREDDADQGAAKAEQDRLAEASRVYRQPFQPTPRPLLWINASTPSLVDAGVQTSPVILSPVHKEGRQTSPALEPGSPSLHRAPEPNEARKRSSGRGSQSTSQETNKSGSQTKAANPQVVSDRMPPEDSREHQHRQSEIQSPETSEPGRSARKRRRLQDDPNTLEIPDTPEHNVMETGTSDVMNAQRSFTAPSPQPLNFPPLKLTDPSSFFIPEDSDEEVEVYAVQKRPLSAPFQHRERDSSPLIVNLLGDEEQPNLQSSFSQNANDNTSEADTASQYAFETAPEGDITQDWETAPEEAINQKARAKARVGTQVLFDITDQIDGSGIWEDDDEFALPAPEGDGKWLKKTMNIRSRRKIKMRLKKTKKTKRSKKLNLKRTKPIILHPTLTTVNLPVIQ